MPVEYELPLPAKGLKKENSGELEQSAESEIEEIILSPEEFAQHLSNVKVRYVVNGEEVTRTPREVIQRDQLYSGRERVIEAKNAESARLLREAQALRDSLSKEKAGAPQKDEESDDPAVFVDQRVNKTISPLMQKMEEQINALLGILQPVIGEAYFREGKERLRALKPNRDFSDYESQKPQMIEIFETKLGRKLSPREIQQITPDIWGQAYLAVRLDNPKPMEGEKNKTTLRVLPSEIERSESSPKGKTVTVAGPQRNISRSLQDVIEGKKTMAEHLKARGIKPMGPPGG